MRVMLAIALFALVLTALVASTGASSTTNVGGRVVDSRERVVPGVRVRAIRAGSKLAEVYSNPDGSYSIEVPGRTPFDLAFSNVGWQPSVLQALDGGTTQRISKVLLREGEVLDPRSRLAAEYAERYLASIDG